MAKIIEKTQRPALIISHNKTLAAQLFREFKDFFPDNAVEYFVSYYDYYQPEAYVPSKDLYIDKDAAINDEIDRLRLSATSSLMERDQVIVVATVSCIYGLGNPVTYNEMKTTFRKGDRNTTAAIAKRLILMQYTRNDVTPQRGNFRVRGDTIDIFPAYTKNSYRILLDWDRVHEILRLEEIAGTISEKMDHLNLYPAKHFVMPEGQLPRITREIREELDDRYRELTDQGKIIEAHRLKTRTEYDLEMIMEMGTCSGIENYSRHLSGRKPGERPAVLLDYFNKDFIVFIDESHVMIPQIRAMYNGDRARKTTLVDYGFRLPSALDNRPLRFEEFNEMLRQTIFVSATPSDYEKEESSQCLEQIIRPTGLLDPVIELRPSEGQMEDLYGEIQKTIARKSKVLITTLTKKMAEDLSNYLIGLKLKTAYLHSEVHTFERVETIKKLRDGTLDIIVGINLLREGLDIPEVALIAILDADKIGFLRSTTSLIQTIGRAARNVDGRVLMYADRISPAMKQAIEETERRRVLQSAYNKKHKITPTGIRKTVQDILVRERVQKQTAEKESIAVLKSNVDLLDRTQRKQLIRALEKEMSEKAREMKFEEAAVLRDEILNLKKQKVSS